MNQTVKQQSLLCTLIIVCLFGVSNPARAGKNFWDPAYTYIKSYPAYNNGTKYHFPYCDMEMMYFDATWYYNCFWKEAPEIIIDGVSLGTASILVYNNGDAAKKQADTVDSWWGDMLTKTVDGVTYRVRFYNPYNSHAEYTKDVYSCIMRVYISSMQAGSTHDIRIKGKWVWEQSTSIVNVDRTWSFNAPTMYWNDNYISSFTPTMTNYNTLSLGGRLEYLWGPTTVGLLDEKHCTAPKVSGSNYRSYSFVPIGTLKSAVTYQAQNTTFSLSDATHNRTNEQQKNGSTVAVEYVIPVEDNGFTTNFYRWYDVSVPGFAYPTSLELDTDGLQWTKQIKLTWNSEESGRFKNGTWSIWRSKAGTTGTGEELISGLSYNKLEYFDSTPEWDINYNYYVYFVPAGTTETYSSLQATVSGALTRSWKFDYLHAEVVDGTKIKLEWKHEPIENASGQNPYVLTLERALSSDTTQWTTVNGFNVTVKSSETLTGTYTDASELLANTGYIYRLSVNLLDKNFVVKSDVASLGGSQLKGFTATRGNFSNMVKLQWQVKQVGVENTDFILYRRPLGSSNDKDWQQIYQVSGTASSYSYDDTTAPMGSYCEYRIAILGPKESGDGTEIKTSTTTDGFTYSTGTISGRITYGTGAAVDGVKVTLKPQNADGDSISSFHSLWFGQSAALSYHTDNEELQQLFGDDFTVQMMVNPSKNDMATDGADYLTFDVGYTFTIKLWYDADKEAYQVGGWMGGNEKSSIYIPANQWSQLTFSHSRADAKTGVFVATPDAIITDTILIGKQVEWTDNALNADKVVIGNNSTENAAQNFRGYVDEVRLFTKALSKNEILRNYNHPLAGTEDGLAIYYPMDEGLQNQAIAYDFSKKDGIANGRHAVTVGTVKSSGKVAKEEQMSLMAYTDVQGNYTIRGVPFSGDGTSYTILPTKGIHEFSPAYLSRFVSSASLVHNSVDFSDISSFPISGKIFYAGTDYPVEGVNFYVDGVACTRGGELIATNANGEYSISVPIGDHYIQVAKKGHVFANDGRYPADPFKTDTCATFIQELKDLEFQDVTLVNFAGRVVGGDIEGKKPLGFGLSENNIGVTQLVLTPLNTVPRLNTVKVKTETTYSYETNTNTVPVASDTTAINSTSWRGAGDDDCRKVFIQTDPATGEFSAMVPPLEYKVSSMAVLSNAAIDFGELPTIDLSDPTHESEDSLKHDDGSKECYTYNGVLKQTYHNPEPTFNVIQDGRLDGSFGIKSYKFKDAANEATISDIYSVGTDGKVTYNYGVDGHKAPLFVQDNTYDFLLEGYEKYENYDASATNPVVSIVPLKDVVVTIDNALSDQQPVWIVTGEVTMDDGKTYQAKEGQVVDLKSNQLMLDSLGQATYTWTVGLPNVATPYTRTIAMTYDINGRQYQWKGSGMEGIIMGDLPSGNNFVTSGPDKLVMILRDPPGTGSSAEWTTGTATSVTTLKNDTWSDSFESGFTSHLGHKEIFHAATGTSAVGTLTFVSTGVEMEDKDDLTTHVTEESEGERGETIETSISIEETVATSEEPDFVGADGDVFVGQATNVIFGNARHIGFMLNGTNFEIGLRNVISTGLSFGTIFNYSQSYIENTLLPNFEMMRESKLTTTTQAEIDKYNPNKDNVGVHNMGQKAGNLYLTTLNPGDDGYGEDGSYTIIIPDNTELMPDSIRTSDDAAKVNAWAFENKLTTVDSVKWINNQIRSWQMYLALNEQEKVEAYELRKNEDPSLKFQNYSFDGGASRSYTWEKDSANTSSWEWTVSAGILFGNRLGFEIKGTGVDWDLEITATGGRHEARDSVNSYTTSFGYTLAEEGSDALSVDVYHYGAFGPIFRTRGGQTSNPYEGEVVTNYYQPGTTIMEATMQIEVPQIEVDVPIVSDIPTGNAANYTLRLGNASEIGEDIAYKLFVLDETNPQGAQLSIDGKVLTEGRLIKVPGNQTLTKTLQLRQTDTSILDFEGNNDPNHELYGRGIGIVFASESQPEDIADTIFIKAYFVPSSSDVALKLSNTTMNTQTGTDINLTFSGFDRNYHNLKAFRLQYKEQGATDWTLLNEYVLDAANKTDNNEMLPASGASVSYTLPMASFPDGNYVFRCVSASTYGLDEVYKYSDEIALVKDTQRPRPMGQPEPTDGILDIGDDLSVTFNEAFLKGEMTKEKNFIVTGVLNGAEIAHETAIAMKNTEATAQTEASITLAGKPFSVDTWVNVSGAGTILSHGAASNKLTVGTDAEGHLVVGFADNTYTSENVVPKNKWAFLTISLTADGTLNANVASDADITTLFSNKTAVSYTGSGPLTVGKQMTGAIHELLLWDEAHDMTTALANRSKTKSPSTRHLIGYWKMNEGEGKTIRDYSRSRNMTMSDETWYLNNVNKAVSLNGNAHLGFMAANSPYTIDDDYAIELWVRGDKQTGEAQLLQAGEVALWLNADGDLMLTGKGANHPAEQQSSVFNLQSSILDNVWHHVALNVLRQGAAAVYVDGERKLSTNADNVGNIATDSIFVGSRRSIVEVTHTSPNDPNVQDVFREYRYDRPFIGQVDEIRVWNATLNANKLKADRKVRLTGREAGLAYYYPFETKMLDDYNQVVTVGTPKDLTGLGTDAAMNFGTVDIAYTDEAPALRTKPTETNVSYNYVASDTKVVINIDENPATIDGCTLNFTVRSLRDENGNFSDPAVWTAFVNQKELVWKEGSVSCVANAANGTSVTATIVNKSGKEQMWTLDGMPSWLQASTEYGSTNPLEETSVTFTVSPSTPIGKYEETVYLKGNNGIETPLTLNVKVTGDTPAWAVEPGEFEQTMNLIGGLVVIDTPSEDSDDIVAAFIDGECRGVAQPKYLSRYDSYFLTMDIYGKADETDSNGNVLVAGDADKTVEFKVYDASTGTIYPVVNTSIPVTFEDNKLVGLYNQPVVITATDEVEQSIDLGKGWNWMSMSVSPKTSTVSSVFANAKGKVTSVKSYSDGFKNYANGKWSGGLKTMSSDKMYAVKTSEAMTLAVTGHRVVTSKVPITVSNKWNWVGFNASSLMSVTEALAGMEPQDGDIVKGQRGIAYYDNYEWLGSLQTMMPGKGYKIYSTVEGDRKFAYPATATALSRVAKVAKASNEPVCFTPVDYTNYSGNMVLIAQLECDGSPVAGVELGVFAPVASVASEASEASEASVASEASETSVSSVASVSSEASVVAYECREAAVTDENGMVFITIPGDEPCKLTFRVSDGNSEFVISNSELRYETDAIVGSPRAPFIINLDEATGISEQRTANGQQPTAIYDLLGRRISELGIRNSSLHKGVYIINGQKKVK